MGRQTFRQFFLVYLLSIRYNIAARLGLSIKKWRRTEKDKRTTQFVLPIQCPSHILRRFVPSWIWIGSEHPYWTDQLLSRTWPKYHTFCRRQYYLICHDRAVWKHPSTPFNAASFKIFHSLDVLIFIDS
jgi:hypothetical protein